MGQKYNFFSLQNVPYRLFSVFSVSSTSSALQVALESLSPREPDFVPCSFLELLPELLASSVSSVGGFLSVTSLGGVDCSLLGSPGSLLISCLMAASSLTAAFSSPALVPALSLSPVLEPAFDLAEASSLVLLSSDECGEGKLSVSELLLAPPGRQKATAALAFQVCQRYRLTKKAPADLLHLQGPPLRCHWLLSPPFPPPRRGKKSSSPRSAGACPCVGPSSPSPGEHTVKEAQQKPCEDTQVCCLLISFYAAAEFHPVSVSSCS